MPIVERSRERYSRTGRVDWAKVDATTDEDIEHHIEQDPDTAPEATEDDLDRAEIVSPDGTRVAYRDRVARISEKA